MKRLTVATVALTLAGCAFADPGGDPWIVDDEPTDPKPVDRPTPADDPTVVERPTPTPTPTEPLACDLEQSEFQETWWVDPHFDGFSPNEGLFVSANGFDGQAMTLSVIDGGTYPSNDLNGLRDVSSDWRTGVFASATPRAEWREVQTGEVHYATDEMVGAAAVSDDGRRAAFILCADEATVARVVDLDGSAHDVELSADGHCFHWGVNRHHAEFTSDGSHLVVSTMGGTLAAVDTATHEVTSIEPHAMLDDPEVYYGTVIADMSVRPGSAEVVTTGADGALRRWSVPSLEQIGDDLAVGAFVINEMTYAPHYTVSPVAFSSDGATLAFVNTDGDVVLRNAAGDEVLPTPTVEDDEVFERADNVPVTLSFGPSGKRVGVGYYWGPAVWGCPGGALERRGSLAIDVPSVVELSDSQNIVPVRIEGNGPIAAMRILTTTGEVYYQASFVDGGLSIWPRHNQPEQETIVVEVDDGYATGQATIQLRFIQ